MEKSEKTLSVSAAYKLSSKSFDCGQLVQMREAPKPTPRKRSVDDCDIRLINEKRQTTKRLSWTRIKKIITDNKVLMGRMSPDENTKKTKDHNHIEHHDSFESNDETTKKLDTSYLYRRKSSSPIFSKSSRLNRSKCSLEYLFQLAIAESDENTINKIIASSKIDINSLYPPGSSALHQACVLGNLQIIKLLIQCGADIEIKTWSGLSAVKVATLFGHFDVAQYLIETGASSRDIQDGFVHDVKLMSTVFVRVF